MENNFSVIHTSDRVAAYTHILPTIQMLLSHETDLIANMANVSAVLMEQFRWHWIGFYIVKGDELVLGPFQGPLACTRIRYDRGVCGQSWAQKKTILVPYVHAFEGHIACSAHSNSEIVVPIFLHNEVIAVLDIDSVTLNDFSDTDKQYLEIITSELQKTLIQP